MKKFNLTEAIKSGSKEMFEKLFKVQDQRRQTRAFTRWSKGWKRNAKFQGRPLTRSMIRRVGSRERALKLGLIKA